MKGGRNDRWTEDPGNGLVRHSSEHAEALDKRAGALAVAHRVDALEDALVAAYDAGRRQGQAETAARLSAVLSEHVRRAIEGIRFELPACPHCRGRGAAVGCEACGGSGRFRP